MAVRKDHRRSIRGQRLLDHLAQRDVAPERSMFKGTPWHEGTSVHVRNRSSLRHLSKY